MKFDQREDRVTAPVSATYRTLLAYPDGYEAGGSRQWPLLVFFHGAGERGDNLELLKKHGPPRLIAEGREFPYIVAAPQCPAFDWWNPGLLAAWLHELAASLSVDRHRIYVTGISMGGFASWKLATLHPERIAALVPICGGGDPHQASRLARVPIWAFHGAKDEVVPAALTQEMITGIEQAGGKPQYTLYPEAGHDSWTEAYKAEEMWQWMDEQQLLAAW